MSIEKMAIVKVQVPLASSQPHAPALIYPQDRAMMIQQHLDEATRAALHGDVKGFFEAEWLGPAAGWKIGKRVAQQAW